MHRVRLTLVAAALTASLTTLSAGCGDSSEEPTPGARPPTAAAHSPTSAAGADGAAVRVVEVDVADGQVSTDDDRVEVAAGTAVRLVVTSDVDDELHVHGVDQTAELIAGQPTAVEFTVDEPGVFEVETHESDLLLLQLLVR